MKQKSTKNPVNTSEAQIPGEWLQLLDDKSIQLVILDAQADAGLAKAIRSQPGWKLNFEDDEVVTFAPAKPR